jgi:hypothetical protein
LLGTIVNGSDGYGIFMDQATKMPVRVRIGASYQGWTLRSLQAGAATFGKGLDHTVLEFPKRLGEQMGGFARIVSATSTRLMSLAPRVGLTPGQVPTADPPPQPNGFPPNPLLGNGPRPPIAVHD